MTAPVGKWSPFLVSTSVVSPASRSPIRASWRSSRCSSLRATRCAAAPVSPAAGSEGRATGRTLADLLRVVLDPLDAEYRPSHQAIGDRRRTAIG